MEADSENRGRGRPRKFTDKELTDAINWSGQLYGELGGVWTRRGEQNMVYAMRAERRIEALWEEREEDWLNRVEQLRPPHSVLTELGRIEDEDAFLTALKWCHDNDVVSSFPTGRGRGPRAKDAAAAVRRYRLGQ